MLSFYCTYCYNAYSVKGSSKYIVVFFLRSNDSMKLPSLSVRLVIRFGERGSIGLSSRYSEMGISSFYYSSTLKKYAANSAASFLCVCLCGIFICLVFTLRFGDYILRADIDGLPSVLTGDGLFTFMPLAV